MMDRVTFDFLRAPGLAAETLSVIRVAKDFSSGLRRYKSRQAASYGSSNARIAPASLDDLSSLCGRENEARPPFLSTREISTVAAGLSRQPSGQGELLATASFTAGSPGQQSLINSCPPGATPGPATTFTELDRSKGYCFPTTLVNQHSDAPAQSSKVLPSSGRAKTTPRQVESSGIHAAAPQNHSGYRQSAALTTPGSPFDLRLYP